MKRILLIILSLFCLFSMSSCARKPHYPNDPLEGLNRVVFAFNMDIDHLLVGPAAKIYKTITPPPFQTGVTNFFNNIEEITTFPNDIAQGKFNYALIDLTRFIVNSTIGLGGLIDVASHIGLPKHYEDFGMTFAYYSDSKTSPYLVVPFLGSMTLRQGVGLPLDALASPWWWLEPASLKYGLFAVNYVNMKAKYLEYGDMIMNAFDPYAFVRNAYLQHRFKQIDDNKYDYPYDKKTTIEESKQSHFAPQAGKAIKEKKVSDKHTLG